MRRYLLGGMLSSDTASQISWISLRVATCGRLPIQVEKFRCSLPRFTSCWTSQPATGMRLVQGHRVSLLWQSQHARSRSGRTALGTCQDVVSSSDRRSGGEAFGGDAIGARNDADTNSPNISPFVFIMACLSLYNQLHAHVIVSAPAFHSTFDQVLPRCGRSRDVVVVCTLMQTQVPALFTQLADYKTVDGSIAGGLATALRSDAQT